MTEDQATSLSLLQGAGTAGLVPRLGEPRDPASTAAAAATAVSDEFDEPLPLRPKAAEDERQGAAGSLPPGWSDLVGDGEGCQAVLVSLWLSAGDRQVEEIELLDLPSQRGVIRRLCDELSRLDDTHRILIFDLAIDTLGQLAVSDIGRFTNQLEKLWERRADDDFVRWAMAWQMRRRLPTATSPLPRPRYGSLQDVQPACELLLSLACHLGSDHEAMARYAFQRAVVHLDLREPEFWTLEEVNCERLDAAVGFISELAPRPRRQLLTSLARCLAADQGITAHEACFVRGVCAALDLPAPTLLPGQVVAPGS